MDNLKLDSSIVDNSVFGIPSFRQSGKPETRIMNIAVTLLHIKVSVGTLLLRCYCLSSDPIRVGSLKLVGTGGAGMPLRGYSPVVMNL